MRALIIGSGGREHALAWRLKNSPSIEKVYAAPGNPGIAQVAECVGPADYVNIARSLGVDFTVVGPEAPLVGGIVDQFRREDMLIVGPTAENAQLEGSKAFSKQFMQQHGIPTARFTIATTPREARDALKGFEFPVVLKTDGLAAGKGVVIAQDLTEAKRALQTLRFPLVIEEFLTGEEVSFIVLCDGERGIPFEPSQDHKNALDQDKGPNTGGMGAYSDSRILSDEQRSDIMDRVILPVIQATAFTGFLYAGLMMTASGPKVLEFNVRLGDPETQPLMMRMTSDFGELLHAAARTELGDREFTWSPQAATCVVMASNGYPGDYSTGTPITGIEQVRDAVVFQAGTKELDGELVTSGGRVLGVTALGKNLRESMNRAYAAVAKIHFDGALYRKDIGAKGLRRYN